MRKINSPGNVSNLFVDYDPVNNPLGTVYSADWGNDVQTDLIKIQEFAGLAEAAGSAGNVLKSIIKISKEQSKEVGEHFHLDTLKLPAEFDSTDTDTAQEYFPSLCLSNINIQTTIDVAEWPLLVPHLRAIQIKYLEGLSGEVASFTCTVSGSNVTLANNTENNRLLVGLAKWVLSHGSYSNWITITISGVEYVITNINTSTRVITVTDTPDSGATACTFFPHRIAASTTTARVFAIRGKALMAPNDSDGLYISNMQMFGYMQGHYHETADTGSGALVGFQSQGSRSIGGTLNTITDNVRNPTTDGTNGTPRTASETSGPASFKHIYIFGRRYIAP